MKESDETNIIAQLEECLNSGKYENRIVLMGEDGVQLIGKPAAMHILSIQEVNGLMIDPHPIMGKQLRVWTGLSKTKMAMLTGMRQNIQWSKFENKQKLISKEAWTLLQLRLGIHPKYELVLKSDQNDE
ncbi:hypothetical protein [Acinetobacter sp. YH01009]|nr:hypothetical protein [Acinetobacter sp. YH01009]